MRAGQKFPVPSKPKCLIKIILIGQGIKEEKKKETPHSKLPS